VFVVLFWMGFEQAGSSMNLWADQVTNRYATDVAPLPSLFPEDVKAVGFPEVKEAAHAVVKAGGGWWHELWNPLSTEAYQSINSAGVWMLAPIFAMLWSALERRRKNPSIPMKMAMGMLFTGMAFAIMTWAGRVEDQPSDTTLAVLPPEMTARADGALTFRDPPGYHGKPVDPARSGGQIAAQGGRLRYRDGKLEMRGVLSTATRDRILRATAPDDFVRASAELALKSKEARAEARARHDDNFSASIRLDRIPPGFDLRYAGFHPRNLQFDAATATLTVRNMELEDKDYKSLLQAASEPRFRDALNRLYVTSSRYKVSGWWLVWFYLLCTIGELCLSPVGLSMVSKLAPAHFATMLMGMWLFTSSFGSFLAGSMAELFKTMPPTQFFLILFAILTAASLLLFALVKKIQVMAHGVN
jgi:POT family proton-dependent oligopeptide transporter